MFPDDNAKWHWQEGNKYAVEGMKTLLLLHGGAAIALLTFVGHLQNASASTCKIRGALLCFGLGALISGLVFVAAYGTQLRYGNKDQAGALWWHHATYWIVGVSVVLFVVGLGFAAFTLPMN